MGGRQSNLWHDRLTLDARLHVREWLDPLAKIAMRCVSTQDAGETAHADTLFPLYDHYTAVIKSIACTPWAQGLPRYYRKNNCPGYMFTSLCFYYGCTTSCNAFLYRLHVDVSRHSTCNLDKCIHLLLAVQGNQPHLIRSFFGSIPMQAWSDTGLGRPGYWAIHLALADCRHVSALRALVELQLDLSVLDLLEWLRNAPTGVAKHEYVSRRTAKHQLLRTGYTEWRTHVLSDTKLDEKMIREGRGIWGALGREYAEI